MNLADARGSDIAAHAGARFIRPNAELISPAPIGLLSWCDGYRGCCLERHHVQPPQFEMFVRLDGVHIAGNAPDCFRTDTQGELAELRATQRREARRQSWFGRSLRLARPRYHRTLFRLD